MDSRLYFVLGDLLFNLLAAALVGWVSWLIVDTGWSMFFAMVVMMFLGMVLAMVVWVPGSILFGAMELMVPMMLSGMMSGMVVGMWVAMSPLDASTAIWIGANCGLLSMVVVWIANNQLRGVQNNPG